MNSARFGITWVLLALAIAGAGIVTYAERQRDWRQSQIDAQGVLLAGVLAKLPMHELVPANEQQGLVNWLSPGATDLGPAYVEVSSADGRSLARTPGIAGLPGAGDSSAAAKGAVAYRVAADGGRFKEYDAPVIVDAEPVAHVRVGYRWPDTRLSGLMLNRQELYRVLPLALCVLAVGALLFFRLRRQMRPLVRADAAIRAFLDSNPSWQTQPSNAGNDRELSRSFATSLKGIGERMHALEAERADALTRARVVSYEKARIESVLQSMPEGVAVLDEAGMTTFVNDKLGPMLGVDPAAVLGATVAQWSPFPELTVFVGGAGLALGESSSGGTIELNSAVNDGCLSVMALPLFSPRERRDNLGTLVVFSDITAQTLARKAQKDLISELSHELKTPLHVIGMYSETLLEPGNDAQAVRIEAGNVIHDEVERVSALINNMLSISRIEMGNVPIKRRRTRLSDLLQDCLDSVGRSGSGQDLKFTLQVPPDLSVVNVDKDLMRVAINNLITNAIKYNRPGGEVIVGANESDEEIAIFVRDTGLGIAQEDQEHVFERFFRGKNGESSSISGHGLGLPLTKEIINVHLGEIDVISTVGEGSEFRVRLRKTTSLLKEAA